jgi:predicted O-linked N-acetylglucosamine transferase (SPINDLY family)
VYHINKLEDATTERLKRHHAVVAAAQRNRRDRPRPTRRTEMRCAADLGGHAAGHDRGDRGSASTWLGYPNTTGVREVGHRIVDSVTDPAPVADALATESLVRLDPCFLCYRPPEDAPALAPLPAPGSPITFVSGNSLQKSRRAWPPVGVLDGVPGSRLLLKMTNLIEADLQRDVRARLVSWGLPVDRTQIMLSVESRTDHLASYGQAHVALDTFPYHGTTTTCESLWMGVPVVTLAGDRHAARVSASLLTAVGTPELIAHTEDEFVERAVTLAGDRERLARYRATLRGMVQASPLCDASAFAKRFGDAVLALVAKTS